AKCNYEALEETGKLGEILFFMRAGSTGSQKYSTMMWAKCNYEALEETGKLGEILFFMRAGSTGSQKYSTMM
ncbi:hypothetical protein ACM2LL_25245, partial [Escherichia coli]